MLIRIYSFFVLVWDVVFLVVGCTLAVLESLFYLVKPPEEKSVEGEIALVVGTTRGVGREMAIQLASLGATVVCVDIEETGNIRTANAANKEGDGRGSAHPYTCDVTDRDQVMKMAAKVKMCVGDVTMLFHCCGVPSPRTILYSPLDIRKTVDLSIMSHFWLLEAFLPAMTRANHGHIVAMSSVAGLTGGRRQVPMCASQFAVQGMMESLSEELRALRSTDNVRLTLVHVYPFIVSKEQARDIRLRIPSYFGTIEPKDAAAQIITAMRRNYPEISVPGYLLFFGNLIRILPRKASTMLRDLLDTGVDFG